MSHAAQITAFGTGLSLCLSLIVAIGAQNLFVLQQGLQRQHVGPVVAVCAGLDVLLMTLGVSGLALALQGQPTLMALLGAAGAALLAAYGLAALRRAWRPPLLAARTGGAPRALGATLAQVLGISLLNPHVYLDTVLLVGTVGARQPPGTQAAFVAGASLGSAIWFTGLGFGARALAPLFARPAAWRVLDAVIAATMLLLAVRLAAGIGA